MNRVDSVAMKAATLRRVMIRALSPPASMPISTTNTTENHTGKPTKLTPIKAAPSERY